MTSLSVHACRSWTHHGRTLGPIKHELVIIGESVARPFSAYQPCAGEKLDKLLSKRPAGLRSSSGHAPRGLSWNRRRSLQFQASTDLVKPLWAEPWRHQASQSYA